MSVAGRFHPHKRWVMRSFGFCLLAWRNYWNKQLSFRWPETPWRNKLVMSGWSVMWKSFPWHDVIIRCNSKWGRWSSIAKSTAVVIRVLIWICKYDYSDPKSAVKIVALAYWYLWIDNINCRYRVKIQIGLRFCLRQMVTIKPSQLLSAAMFMF